VTTLNPTPAVHRRAVPHRRSSRAGHRGGHRRCAWQRSAATEYEIDDAVAAAARAQRLACKILPQIGEEVLMVSLTRWRPGRRAP